MTVCGCFLLQKKKRKTDDRATLDIANADSAKQLDWLWESYCKTTGSRKEEGERFSGTA